NCFGADVPAASARHLEESRMDRLRSDAAPGRARVIPSATIGIAFLGALMAGLPGCTRERERALTTREARTPALPPASGPRASVARAADDGRGPRARQTPDRTRASGGVQ